jgi:predicted hydrocarbon binding protein
MSDFADYEYDFRRNRFAVIVAGEPMILHCHHYNCFLQRSIQDAEYIDSVPILVGAAAEVALAQLTRLLSGTAEIPVRKAAVEGLYRACGLGLIDLGAVTDRGGEVRTRSTHYSIGWKEKFGRSRAPVAFFSTGFLAGALAAVYGLPLADVQARQTACVSTGAAEDVFVLGRGPANFTIFPPRQSPVLIPVGNDSEPATSVDREAVSRAVAGMPLPVNAEGLIPLFGLYLTRLYADYCNRISFAFEREMTALAGRQGVDAAANLFIEAGHVCAFFTFGGIMTSPEWDALMLPMLKTREDWVHGIIAWLNGGGKELKVVDLSSTQATFRMYNDYESIGYRRMYGTADHGVCYLNTGAFAGIMNLIYLGNIDRKPDLTQEFYDRLFKGGRAFQGRMTACQAMDDPYTEIRVELAEPAAGERRLEGARASA